jgi:ABC-2 type transport system permease protein
MRPVLAQARVELLLTLRRGESVLLTFAIPMLLLWFFSTVDVLPTPDHLDDPVDFLVPGILALAVMSTAMVSLAIATGFERSTGVLKLLGSTPLTRRQLLAAKIGAIVVVEILQLTVLVVEGLLLGWEVDGAQVGAALAALALATIAFAGIGMLMAGTLPALTTLAAANGLYLVLLLVGGMVVPLDELGGLEPVAKLLPSGALSEAVHGALEGTGIPASSWVVLAVWAVVTPAVAAWRFRWD